MQKHVLLAATAALTVFGAQALAQGTPKAPSTAQTPRSAASMECSRQADAKGLHGKARQNFRSKCIRSAAGKGKTQPFGFK
jgi:hypothetical protein